MNIYLNKSVVEGLWIHPQKSARGSTGCFKYITVTCTDGRTKFILGSLPVRIGADVVALVKKLLDQAQKFVCIEIALLTEVLTIIDLLKYCNK